MIIYFFDRFWNPLGKASENLPKGINYYDDHEVEDVETGTSTFEVYVGFDEENRNIVRAYGQEATYFVTTDEEGHGRLWSVIDDESDEEAMFHYFYGEDAGMDLINEMLPAWGSPGSAKPIVYYVEKAAADSGFEIGINEIPNLTRTLDWDGEATALNRLQSILTQFDNAELQFRFDIDENTLELKHKYIDILKKRGNDTGIELRMNREVKNIRMKRSRANMFNAYRCYGATPEGKENPITLNGYSLTTAQKEINPETGKARFVLSGNILKDTESNTKYSRYLNPYEQGEDEGYYTGIYNSEATTQNALANETILQLKKTGYPEVNYEVDVIVAPRTLKAGDYVSIVNDKDELYLEGRILKTDRSRSNDTFEITLGDYLIRDSGIAEQIQAMADKLKGKDGVSNFIFYAYADDDKGTGFSLNPQGKKYTGLTVSLVNQQPSDPSVYTWSLSKGSDGRGILGSPISTFAKSKDGTIPPTTWSSTRPNVEPGEYLWTRIVTTYTDNTTSETQTPTLMGADGPSGLGIRDKSISYAVGTSGNTPPSSGWQVTIPIVSANQYLWTRTTIVYTDDSKTDAYSVGKMGADGANAKLLYLTASAENMAFNADDTPKTTQTINISAKLQNVTGTATFTAIPYIGNTAQTAITLGGTGNTRTLTSSQWTNKDWTLIAITATLDNLSDTLSIVKVKDGKEGETFYPHRGYLMADGTFTKVYPADNLLTNSQFKTDLSGWAVGAGLVATQSPEYITLKKEATASSRTFLSQSIKASDISPNTTYSLSIEVYIESVSGANVGRTQVFMRTSSGTSYVDSPAADIDLTIVGQWQTITASGNSIASSISTAQVTLAISQDIIITMRVRRPKLSEGNSALPYTPKPSENYENAYPKYEGFYSDTNQVGSDNPDDYKPWTPFMGPQGPPGKDGENGQNAKEVISGYLSNESIIVPANSSGVVTDFSKAIGDFVVYEGQSKITSGVTYSKVSETGMTSTINSAGRYTVTALSNDVGTATYQAVYKDVTLQKIVIAVKNKQGLTGPKGDSTGIIAQNTVPMSPYVGMLWKNTGASGYIDGVTYRWTGSKWEIYVLAAANIVAETLAAISANLGTVTAGIIQSTDGKTFFNLTEGTFKLGEKFIYDGNKLTVRGEINADADVWLYNSDFADRNAGLHFRFVDSGAGGKLNAIYLGYNPDMISTGYSRYYIGNPDAVASQVIVGGTFTAGSAVETPIVRTTSHIATPKINLGTSSSLEQGVVRLRPQTSAVAYVDFYDQTKQSVRLVQDSDNKFKIIATYDDVRIQTLGHLYVMNVAGTGYRQVKASSFDQQSSISHKYDIRDLEDGYFDRFKEIKLHSYRRSDDEKYYQLGVIYEENIDQPFTHSEKGEEGGVDLYSFITFIGKALQESINKIEVLEEKLNGYNSN